MFRCCHLSTVLLFAVALTGCASTVTSNTARTAKEQLLLSNAIDKSLDKVDFTPMYNQNVYLDEKYLECVDKPYILGSLRHRVMRAGGKIVAKPDEAAIVMEVRSGGVGTDTSEAYLGTPEIALPGMLTVPEIRLAERKSQFGYAKLGLVVYDAGSRQILGDGGVAMARSTDNNSYVAGIGPFQSGTLKSDIGQAKQEVPGMDRRQLPTTVAFAAPAVQQAVAEPDVQFASGTKEVE